MKNKKHVFTKNNSLAPLGRGLGRGVNAFTLAEVLITLGVIGVVAAITMPTLIQKQNEKATVTRLKKAYSTFSQAYNMAVQEYGTPDEWGFSSLAYDQENGYLNDTNRNSSKIMFDIMSKHLKLVKTCAPGDTLECLGVNDKRNWIGVLSDGTSFKLFPRKNDCSYKVGNTPQLESVCGDIYVYLKGNKPEQQRGIDQFAFYITKFGILPKGTTNDTGWPFNGTCYSSTKEYGDYDEGCAAWVLYNENMDYLHCDDLSWDGKTKCK